MDVEVDPVSAGAARQVADLCADLGHEVVEAALFRVADHPIDLTPG